MWSVTTVQLAWWQQHTHCCAVIDTYLDQGAGSRNEEQHRELGGPLEGSIPVGTRETISGEGGSRDASISQVHESRIFVEIGELEATMGEKSTNGSANKATVKYCTEYTRAVWVCKRGHRAAFCGIAPFRSSGRVVHSGGAEPSSPRQWTPGRRQVPPQLLIMYGLQCFKNAMDKCSFVWALMGREVLPPPMTNFVTHASQRNHYAARAFGCVRRVLTTQAQRFGSERRQCEGSSLVPSSRHLSTHSQTFVASPTYFHFSPSHLPTTAMPIPAEFKSSVSITHIGTAASVLTIDGISFLTDPVFDPAGSEYPKVEAGIVLKNADGPALQLDQLPPISAVLLSHEDHEDNLDTLGRTLLNGRHVLTTVDGAKNLAPRPGVQALRPWESTTLVLQGKTFKITGTPCEHLPGGECTGFVIENDAFGTAVDGRPNAVFFSGDTVYTEELSNGIRKKFSVVLAILSLGAAIAPTPDGGSLLITMDGKQAARLSRELGVQLMVPMHFESWGHFHEHGEQLRAIFAADEYMKDRVQFVAPGVPTKLI